VSWTSDAPEYTGPGIPITGAFPDPMAGPKDPNAPRGSWALENGQWVFTPDSQLMQMVPQGVGTAAAAVTSNPWLLAGLAVGALVLGGLLRRGRERTNLDEFYDAKGILHPIRASAGYDPEVEEMSREEHEEREREETYRGVGRGEMAESGIERPPYAWARGMSLSSLASIARDAGVSPYEYGWWDSAHLIPGGKEMQVRQGVGVEVKRKRSGEYQSAVLEGGHRGDVRRSARTTAAVERGRKPKTRAERIAARTEARRTVARAGEDLPF
jgi:hypothetical protein